MSGSGLSVVLPNMIEFIPTLVAFTIVAIILYKFGWPKFDDILNKRADKISSDLKSAEDNKLKSQQVYNDNLAKISDAENKANDILAKSKKAAEKMNDKLAQDAKVKADYYHQKATSAIQAEKKLAISEIEQNAVELSMYALSEFVSKDLDDKKHREIIEKYIKQAGSFSKS